MGPAFSSPKSARSQIAGKGALRILVVEDDEDSREMMVQLLQLIGVHTIESADDGEEGINRLRHDPAYDLVITDIGLPGLDGMEMVDLALKEGLIAAENVIICSAHMLPQFDARARGATYIPKPVDTNAIIRTVRTAAARLPDKSD